MSQNIPSKNKNSMKNQYKTAETVAIVGVMAAFAAILSYVEAIISFSIWIPGVKIGLANIAIVVVLHLYGAKEALAVNVVRIIVVGLLFGNMFSIFFSLAGALTSFITMVLVKKTDWFTILGVSVTGGVAHNLGQMIVASIVVDTYSVLYYMPALMIAGIITGIVIGIVGNLIVKYMEIILKRKLKST